MQGVVIVVVGIALMYLVLSGKMDCLIASFRACSGSSVAPEATKTKVNNSTLPTLNPTAKIDSVLSYNI